MDNAVYILRNQHQQYLNKSHEWIAGGDSKTLYRSSHKDEAINEKVELTVKNPDLRIRVVAASQGSNGRLEIDGESFLPKASEIESEPESSYQNENKSEPQPEAKPEQTSIPDFQLEKQEL
ncbi:hypothetical protein [Agaribacterium sp. ZY112]|uniref:hypothetical protein n=1 Tax=Agaribacterium sp. ZY112 TaxID=3233574 RepID=UPI003525A919